MGTHPYYVHPVSVVDKLIEHLYQRTPEILKLFEHVPQSDNPIIRIATFEYELLSRQTTAKTGNYWQRTLLGVTPPFPRLELTAQAGVHGNHDPFLFDTFAKNENGYSTVTCHGKEHILQRVALLINPELNSSEPHPYLTELYKDAPQR